MKKLVLLLILSLSISTSAQNVPEKPPTYRTEIVTVVESERRFTKNFLMIVDKSGSMSGDDVTQAFSAFRMISQQPVDEMQLGVIAFGDNVERWQGIPEPKAAKPVPRGWAAMPSQIAVRRAHKFLKDANINGAATKIMLALNLLKNETRKDAFDVIIISDGIFDNNASNSDHKSVSEWFIAQIDAIIKHRTQRKLPGFRLHFYGINIPAGSSQEKVLKVLAKKYGTFINERRIDLEEEDGD